MQEVVQGVVQTVTGLLIATLQTGAVQRLETGEETSQCQVTYTVSQVTGTVTVLVTLLNSVVQVLHS